VKKIAKPLAAGASVLATIASVWWFALRPRRKRSRVSKA
jgi:cbb3-type cytochrome oxidase subunit 3